MNDTAAKSPAHETPETHGAEGIQQEKETFISEIREKMNQIEAKLRAMRDESSRLAGDLKTKADENLVRLDGKYKEFKMKFEELKNTTEKNWQNDKANFSRSFHDFTANFKGLFS